MKKAIMFMLGAVVGSAATYVFTKTKYEKFANDEITEIREYYKSKLREETPEIKQDESEVVKEYKTIVKNYSDISSKKEPVTDNDDAPYVISPEEFGEEYDTINLTYYANNILTDDKNEKIDDVFSVIGDALNHFGDYEDDAVHVRDDIKRVDYEILKDINEWEE